MSSYPKDSKKFKSSKNSKNSSSKNYKNSTSLKIKDERKNIQVISEFKNGTKEPREKLKLFKKLQDSGIDVNESHTMSELKESKRQAVESVRLARLKKRKSLSVQG